MLRSFPKVGVDAALCEVMEEMEEELSARARGAKGGGLPETGGLNGRVWRQYKKTLLNLLSHMEFIHLFHLSNRMRYHVRGQESKGKQRGNNRTLHMYQVGDWFPRGQLWS